MRYLVARFFLMPLVTRNYRRRMAGEVADEFYWADRWMLELGYSCDERGTLYRFPLRQPGLRIRLPFRKR